LAKQTIKNIESKLLLNVIILRYLKAVKKAYLKTNRSRVMPLTTKIAEPKQPTPFVKELLTRKIKKQQVKQKSPKTVEQSSTDLIPREKQEHISNEKALDVGLWRETGGWEGETGGCKGDNAGLEGDNAEWKGE